MTGIIIEIRIRHGLRRYRPHTRRVLALDYPVSGFVRLLPSQAPGQGDSFFGDRAENGAGRDHVYSTVKIQLAGAAENRSDVLIHAAY